MMKGNSKRYIYVDQIHLFLFNHFLILFSLYALTVKDKMDKTDTQDITVHTLDRHNSTTDNIYTFWTYKGYLLDRQKIKKMI